MMPGHLLGPFTLKKLLPLGLLELSTLLGIGVMKLFISNIFVFHIFAKFSSF